MIIVDFYPQTDVALRINNFFDKLFTIVMATSAHEEYCSLLFHENAFTFLLE